MKSIDFAPKGNHGLIGMVEEIIIAALNRKSEIVRFSDRTIGKFTYVHAGDGKQGPLTCLGRVPKNLRASIIARLKIMGNLSIAQHNILQSGECSFGSGNIKVTLRIISFPAVSGREEIIITFPLEE